ncbi:MAG: chemotaxis protein CheC [Gracilibacteraceae bacterium]|jgi:chemotaxis protein CheC|nr:chemotaxis protein CheC [Gracilibacteraceae bacterium]
MVEYGKFNDIQLDVLKEIGNIGSGNAASSLALMIGKTIDMAVPRVNMMHYSDLAQALGGPENLIVGIMIDVSDDLQGTMMFLLQKEFTHEVFNALLGTDSRDFSALSEMDLSVIQEIGNILSASYLNAIASLTGLKISISVPAICVDMVGAILSVPAIKYGDIGDEVLLIEGAFVGRDDKEDITTKLILILEESSLALLMGRLGVA